MSACDMDTTHHQAECDEDLVLHKEQQVDRDTVMLLNRHLGMASSL
jgi:hypothetical protein